MKKIIKILPIFVALSLGLFISCNDFLDEMPDNRAELNSYQKIKDLLVDAYTNVDPMMIYEHRTDNVMDNGKTYGDPDYLMVTENYFWKDISQVDWDAPEFFWQRAYHAIATANIALEAFIELGEAKEEMHIKGEALICRAYHHFLLANTFCLPYDTSIEETAMGLPYVIKPEKVIGVTYDRGTLKSLYENIAKDIEEGFSLINDDSYRVPSYHFTKRAAAAFAAKFYLFYGKYELSIKYADIVIGESTSIEQLRSYEFINKTSSSADWRNLYISKDDPANLLFFALRSRWGRTYRHDRYSLSSDIASYISYRSAGPWGSTLSSFDYLYSYTSAPGVWQPKYLEIFEVTDVVANTGQPHVVYPALTTDETILNRAEAKVLLKQYQAAADDLSLYYVSKGGKAATLNQIIDFYVKKELSEKELIEEGLLKPWLVLVKPLSPLFVLEEGDQERMIQGILHARRIETAHSGLRWLDIRRYGIEVVHPVDEGEPIVLSAHDLRKVIQIPQSVVLEGIASNPR